MKASNVVELPRKDPTREEVQIALNESSRSSSQHQEAIRAYYNQYVSLGWHPLKLQPGSKKITEKDWATGEVKFSAQDFKNFNNIGILLGEISGGLTDVDIDDLALVEAAPLFLPATGASFGRYYGLDHQQVAHHLYRCVGDQSFDLKRPDGKRMAIEIRSAGKQTVFPPSYILDKERRLDLVCWRGGSKVSAPPLEQVAEVSFDKLRDGARLLAATVYSVPMFKPGSFHDDMLAWAGLLAKAGYSRDDARKSTEYIVKHTGQQNLQDRLAGVDDTFETLEMGENVAGISVLRDSNWDAGFLAWLKLTLRIKSGIEADGRPQVRVVSTKETELFDDTLKAMISTKKFYNLGGPIAVINRENGADNAVTARMTPLTTSTAMAAWLTREIQFIQSTLDKTAMQYKDQLIKAPTSVSTELADISTFRGDLPLLMGVSNVPLITKSGRIIEDSWGYDSELKMFFACRHAVRKMFPDEALAVLKELFDDFPFALGNAIDDDEAPHGERYGRYFAAAISAVMSAVVRPALDICPAYVITSSQWSDGKSVMSNAIAAAVGMEGGSPNSPLTRGGSDEEQEKQISSVLAKGKRVIVYDNHDGEFRSAALTETLTSIMPEFRVLGKSEVRTVPNRSMFIINGVNIVVAGDIQTRSVMIRLARSDLNSHRKFKHPDLVGWAGENSEHIVSAVISLIEWALHQEDGSWVACHRFKLWDYLVRRTVMLATGADVSPPANEDVDRVLDPVEEVKYEFLEWVLDRWQSGVRDAKYKNYLRGNTLSQEIADGSPQEGWINVISRRRYDPLDKRIGYALSAVKEFPFQVNGQIYRIMSRSVDKRSMYWVETVNGVVLSKK